MLELQLQFLLRRSSILSCCIAENSADQIQVDPCKPLFGFIGRLEEQKGVDILLDALPEVAKSGDIQVRPRM